MNFPLSTIGDKILRVEGAATLREKNKSKKIVFTNGCFDILHYGHLSYLAEASLLGDILIVGLNDDDSIRRLKGPKRPINDEKSRLFQIASLSYVDAVILFYEDTPANLIKIIQPDILVKGGDYSREKVVGWEIVEGYGGEVKVLKLYEGYSTTKIEQKVLTKNESSPTL